jgi:putative membrane protein
MRRFLEILIVLPLVAFAPAALAGPADDDLHYWGHGYWGEGHMIFGGFMMILFVALVIVLVVFAVRWIGGAPHPPSRPSEANPTALDILEQRYAHGEIDQEEFRARKQDLSR